jgi:hypothetical protein
MEHKKLKLSRGIIEQKIKEHHKENYNPQDPKLDYEFPFEHKEHSHVYQLYVVYSTSNIRIYTDEEISCKCGVFDVELTFIRLNQNPKAKSLSTELNEIEYELNDEYERECYEQRQEENYIK